MMTDDTMVLPSDRAFVPSASSPQAVSPAPGSIPSAGDLRVWWVPQVPMAPFEVAVPDLATAIFVMDTLGRYDAFQFEHNVKPDYCNVGGLSIFEDGEWIDWWDDDGKSIDDLRRDPAQLASAIEAQRAATGTGAVHESAAPQEDAK